MNLDCSFLELVRKDFGALWKCKEHDGVVEISTPYLYPQSKFVRVFLTQKEGRYIVTEYGDICDLLNELLPEEDFSVPLDELAKDCGVKRGTRNDGTLYFKECTDPKFITSLILDVANFASKSANVLLASAEHEEDESEKDKRFKTTANEFVRTIISPDQSLYANHAIPGMPDLRFSGVVESDDGIWILSYITGRTMREFRRSTSDTALSFKEAWESESKHKIQATIPVMNNHDAGYNPQKLMGRFLELKKDAKHDWVTWTNRGLIQEFLQERRN